MGVVASASLPPAYHQRLLSRLTQLLNYTLLHPQRASTSGVVASASLPPVYDQRLKSRSKTIFKFVLSQSSNVGVVASASLPPVYDQEDAKESKRAMWLRYQQKRLESLQAVDELVRDVGACMLTAGGGRAPACLPAGGAG